MSGIAVACLTLSTWNAIRQNFWTSVAIGVGGICLEVALMILKPSHFSQLEEDFLIVQNFKDDDKFHLSAKLAQEIESIECCYPVKAIDPSQIQNKQKGSMMGQACGDAIGLFTEFTTKKQAQTMMDGHSLDLGPTYPEKFKNGYNWHHINRFIKNGWTDDTDQALSLLRALYRNMNGNEKDQQLPFTLLFAQQLMKWRKYGLCSESHFIGRQRPYCMGLGALVASVLQESTFLKHPIETAERVWAKSPETALQSRPAANGAIMRTAPIGLIFYHSLLDVICYTIEACKVTHADPRCIASCVALTVAIALSLRGYARDAIFDAAEASGLAVLRDELQQVADKKLLSSQESQDLESVYARYAKEFQEHLHGDWNTLDLDEGYQEKDRVNKIGYTFKCMGAAFYALHLADQYQKEGKSDIFRLIIEELTAEGGDADTNGAAAGALIGVYLGFQNQFPLNWTTHLADLHVIEQAIQHLEELSLIHQQNLAMQNAEEV